MMSTIAPTSEPGLRMAGKYSSSTGLILDFGGDAVTLDCGPAHVKQPYTVENAPTQLLIHVNNNGGPFTLAVAPDNTLRGSGSHHRQRPPRLRNERRQRHLQTTLRTL